MKWDVVKGKWHQIRGDAKRKWGELTDDDLDQAAGDREKLGGIVQERYGRTKEEVDRELDEWAEALKD